MLIFFDLLVINNGAPINPQAQNCAVELNSRVFAPLFHTSCAVLNTEFNYGGAENFFNFARDKMSLLELLSNNFHILTRALNQA